MNDTTILKSHDDFNLARGRELLVRLQFFMNPEKEKLLSFHDVKHILRPRGEAYLGMKTVPLNLIVGSEGRYKDFNKFFLPKNDHVRARWERIDQAHIKDIVLPPVTLYEIGGVYFVRDGNHRVSVAKAQGVEMIDAEVTSLDSDVLIEPGMTTVELRGVIIAREKEAFYHKTHFGILTGCFDLDFSRTGRYDVIYQHIKVHQYYINEKLPETEQISLNKAIMSWYKNVYEPILRVIEDMKLCAQFPERTPADLYVWISKRWDELKREYGNDYELKAAAAEFSASHKGAKNHARKKQEQARKKQENARKKQENAQAGPLHRLFNLFRRSGRV